MTPPIDRGRAEERWRRAALLLGALVLSIGCSPLATLSFLMPGDRRIQPEYPLACKDKKETKVVVLASSSLDTRPETFGADQDLAERVIFMLKKNFDEDGIKVKFIPHYQVRDYHNKNPMVLSPYEVGKHFGVDKVVYLEVSRLTLYKEGSARQLFLGRVDMTVTVTDMAEPREGGPVYHKEYVNEYPRSGEIAADSVNPTFFRAHFIDHVAKGVTRLFTPYSTEDRLETQVGP